MKMKGLLFSLHRFFTADDVTGIHAATGLIYRDHQPAYGALIGVTFFNLLL